MKAMAHYSTIAALFDYPASDYPEKVQEVRDLLGNDYPLAAGELDAFTNALPLQRGVFTPEALDTVQEIFTRSFDVQSITTLGVGYVMFGDDYKRGELLVNLSREHTAAGIDCGSELSDHLPNVLRLIARWEDRDLVEEFVQEILHPAIERMLAEFGPRRMAERNRLYKRHFKTLIELSTDRGTLFQTPLTALLEVLKQDFSLSEWKPPEQDNDFLRSIGRELDIEASEGRPAPSGKML